MTHLAEMRYKADITAGALKLPESRIIADLLLRKVDAAGWKDAILKRNVLQARSPATASRLTKLIRARLETMGPDLWKLVRDGSRDAATESSLGRKPQEGRVFPRRKAPKGRVSRSGSGLSLPPEERVRR